MFITTNLFYTYLCTQFATNISQMQILCKIFMYNLTRNTVQYYMHSHSEFNIHKNTIQRKQSIFLRTRNAQKRKRKVSITACNVFSFLSISDTFIICIVRSGKEKRL